MKSLGHSMMTAALPLPRLRTRRALSIPCARPSWAILLLGLPAQEGCANLSHLWGFSLASHNFFSQAFFLHQCVYIRFTHIMNMQPRLYVGSAMHHANCPDHLALGDVATLLTILQTAPINQHHQARFKGEWYMLLDFLRPHMSVGDNVKFSRSIQENPTVSPGDLVKGCRFRRLNVTRKIVIKDVPSLLTVALDICKLLRWDNAAYAKDVAVPWEALYLQPCVSWLCPLVTVNRFGPSISKRL